MQKGMDRLLDSFAEGVIDKDQFTARMNRTKERIRIIDENTALQTSDEGRPARLRPLQVLPTEASKRPQNKLSNAAWSTKRDVIRTLVRRIEIGRATIAIVLRLPTDSGARASDPIMVTSSRA